MSVMRSGFKGSIASIAFACGGAFVLSGCTNVSQTLKPRQNFTTGYVVDQQALDLVPVGSSREQVVLSLGTPSTTNTVEGKEAFYYISQERTRAAAFARTKVTSQRVLAVYFDGDAKVERIADYGLQDGKVFDFITRTTPTGGADAGFLLSVIRGLSGGGSGANTARSILTGI
jgi:outer membrane protein assembly factor BamE (lipoprotein component of BamABCDE complex)